MSLKTIHKGSKAKKGTRSLKISPIWSRIEWPLTHLNKPIDRLCCAVHNLSIRLFIEHKGVQNIATFISKGSTCVCVCDKVIAHIICRSVYSKQARLQNLVTYDMQHTMCRSENSKRAPFFNTCKIYFFKTLNSAFKIAFLHGSLNQTVYFFTMNLGL